MFEKIFTRKKEPAEKSTDSKGTSRREFLKVMAGASVGFFIHGSFADAVEAQTPKKESKLVFRVLPELPQFSKETWNLYKKSMPEFQTLKNDIEFIDNRFGDSALDITYNIKTAVREFERLVDEEKKGKDISEDMYARSAMRDFQEYFSVDAITIQARGVMRQARLSPPLIAGFENAKGCGNEELRTALEQRFGREWLYGAFDSLTYVNSNEKLKTFKVAGNAGDRKINIFKLPKFGNMEYIERIMAHELAHEHDWRDSIALTKPEKLRFLREITQIFDTTSRLKDDYVDKVIPKEFNPDFDPQYVDLLQLNEFWATLNELYNFDYKKIRQHPAELALVEKWRNAILDRLLP
jgi:hypothetical protein